MPSWLYAVDPWVLSCSVINDEFDVDGRIDRCFARHKMVNPVMYNGEKQPERIETGALGVCGHIPVQECFAQ